MSKVLAAMLAVFALSASAADIERHERDGQVVIVVRSAWQSDLIDVVNEVRYGRAWLRDPFTRPWLLRIRTIDGVETCEKFWRAPPGWKPERVQKRVDYLFAQPCE